jgi:hypothetical protein
MKSFNYNLTDKHIDECINSEDYNFIRKHEDILIQIFSGQTYKDTKKVLHDIKINGEKFLQGIYYVAPDIIIARSLLKSLIITSGK